MNKLDNENMKNRLAILSKEISKDCIIRGQDMPDKDMLRMRVELISDELDVIPSKYFSELFKRTRKMSAFPITAPLLWECWDKHLGNELFIDVKNQLENKEHQALLTTSEKKASQADLDRLFKKTSEQLGEIK